MSETGPDTAVLPTALSNPEGWVDLHGDVLFAFAFRSVGNRSTAEDLVQETLLAAFWFGRRRAGVGGAGRN